MTSVITINHDLFIEKIAFGIENDFLKLLWNYSKYRWQRTKLKFTYSSWSELLHGVPQGSILGPLLFNVYINDLFYNIDQTDICNFADDTTPHASGYELKDVLLRLEHDSNTLLEWFRDNFMTLNEGKCHLLVCGHKHECSFANLGNTCIWEEYSAKLLGILIDTDSSFQNQVYHLSKSSGRKIDMMAQLLKKDTN